MIKAAGGGSNDSRSAPERDQLLLRAVPEDKATGSPHLEVLPGGGGSANSRVSVHSGREDSVNTLGGDLSLGSEEQCHNHTDVFTP